MMKLVRVFLLPLALAAGHLNAQVAAPSPLVTSPATVSSNWIVAEGRGNAALQAGFPATAAGIYREILRDETLTAETRQTLTLALVTALLDAGEAAAAEKILLAYDGPKNAPYQLRVGLLAANARRIPQAKAALAAGKAEDLAPADRGWWYFLQASTADAENDFARRNAAFDEAAKAAVSDLQRTRFALGQEQMKLRVGVPSEPDLAAMRSNMEKFGGQNFGYDYTRTYAAALNALGRKSEALLVLQRQLATLPPAAQNAADQLRLWLGLIAGEDSLTGRRALTEIVAKGQKPETQRIALQLLARGAKATPANRQQLLHELKEFIDASPPHPIIEDLLLVCAQTELEDKDYKSAEEYARQLLDRYPGSTLKAEVLGVRLTVAWEQKRYRTAADVIAQLRALLGPGRERAELGVLLAEAFFRAEDYKNAADAYAAALREKPAVEKVGVLIFQRVLSDIRADQLDSAAKQLDDAAANPDFDAVNRWQAEWNLVLRMQVSGQMPAAYARVNRLLGGTAQGVPEELRIRLMWLRAKLSFDNGHWDTAMQQADELLALLQTSGKLDPALQTNVASMARLLKAQALLKLSRDKEGLEVLSRLRKDYGTTSAAQYSYLIQASYLAEPQRGDLVAALAVLVSFVDNKDYRQSEYVPVALYEAALNLEKQGLDRHLRDAYEKMLERLIRDYPQDELVFYARLKQGDLLRRLNDLGAARQVYEFLVNNYAQHPDVLLAEIALADTLFAQGTNNVVNYESAVTIFERLRDLESAPVDLRAEAGFMWGYAWAKRGQPDKAQAVFWSVVDAFLLDAAKAGKLGAKGRYWVAKSLLELAQIHEDAGRLDEAQRAYRLIVDNKLYGVALAQAKLARFRPSGGGKP